MNNTIIKTKIKKKMSNTNTSNNKQAPVNKKEPNDIRIGQNSRVRNVVRYCNSYSIISIIRFKRGTK